MSTTTINEQDFRDDLVAGIISNSIIEVIRDAETWEPEALNEFIVKHPAMNQDEATEAQTVQALLYTLHRVLSAIELAEVREDVEARLDV